MQARCPVEKAHVVFAAATGCRQQLQCHPPDARSLLGIDVIAPHEFVHGHFAHVLPVKASQQVVEDAFAHGGFGDIHLLDPEFGEQAGHDGEAAGDDRAAVARQAGQFERVDMAGLDDPGAQLGEAVGGDAARRPAVLFEDFAQCARGAGRADGLLPVGSGKFFGNDLGLDPRGDFGGFQRGLVDRAAGKKALREIDAAHVQAFALVRLQAMPDDELGGAAADVDHQPAVGRGGPRFFAPGDNFDRVAERGFGLTNKDIGVAGDAQGRGADAADRFRRQAAQAFAKALQTGQRTRLGGFFELLVGVKPAGQTHGFLQRIERIQLVAGHSRHFQAEGIGAEVDCRKGVVGFHTEAPKNR